MGESTYCPICGKAIGDCCHKRLSMIANLLEATDKVERGKDENR